MAVVYSVFVYGTLLAPQVVRRVLGRVPHSVPARVAGYGRYTMRGQLYPGARPEPGGVLDGRVCLELSAAELGALDDYEGEAYERTAAVAEPHEPLAAGSNHDVQLYVVRPTHLSQLSEQRWDLERFLAQHAADFGKTWR